MNPGCVHSAYYILTFQEKDLGWRSFNEPELQMQQEEGILKVRIYSSTQSEQIVLI